MTNKEAISYLESIPKYIDYNNEDYYAVSWEILEAIELAKEALTAQQWIPCSQRVPEDGFYLVTNKWHHIDLLHYQQNRGWHHGNMQDTEGKPSVIAWMPLPNPYKGETE